MSDLIKAPEGATHYAVTDTLGVCWYIISDDKYKYLYDSEVGQRGWYLGYYPTPKHKIKPINSWNIYNNTKPLRELTEEQRGLLFNHWCNGGEAQIFNGDGWSDVLDSCNLINRNYPYRAKQKSERELFINAIGKFVSSRDGWSLNEDDAGEMFDAGFKAPQTKDNK